MMEHAATDCAATNHADIYLVHGAQSLPRITAPDNIFVNKCPSFPARSNGLTGESRLGNFYVMKEPAKKHELRALIRDSSHKPVRICMDDGRSYTISHPDFGMVADDAVVIGSGPGHNLGGLSFVICYFDHISRVELLKGKTKAA